MAVVLLVPGIELVAVVLMCGGCPGGGGLSEDLRVLRCVSQFVEWDSFVKASRHSSGSSIPSLPVLYLAITVVLVLAQLQFERF